MTWPEVFAMPMMEFLVFLQYSNYLARKELENIRKQQARLKK